MRPGIALYGIGPAPDDLLETYEISSAVNHAANDSAELIAPVTAGQPLEAPPAARAKPKKPDDQLTLF